MDYVTITFPVNNKKLLEYIILYDLKLECSEFKLVALKYYEWSRKISQIARYLSVHRAITISIK